MFLKSGSSSHIRKRLGRDNAHWRNVLVTGIYVPLDSS
jgi:hypothetical protein